MDNTFITSQYRVISDLSPFTVIQALSASTFTSMLFMLIVVRVKQSKLIKDAHSSLQQHRLTHQKPITEVNEQAVYIIKPCGAHHSIVNKRNPTVCTVMISFTEEFHRVLQVQLIKNMFISDASNLICLQDIYI